jgi:hypothetical protein
VIPTTEAAQGTQHDTYTACTTDQRAGDNLVLPGEDVHKTGYKKRE